MTKHLPDPRELTFGFRFGAAAAHRRQPDYTPPVTVRYTQWAGYMRPAGGLVQDRALHEEQETYIHTQGALLGLIERLTEHNFLYKTNTSFGPFFTWWWYYEPLRDIIHQWELQPFSTRQRSFRYDAVGRLERDVAKRIWSLQYHKEFLDELHKQVMEQ